MAGSEYFHVLAKLKVLWPLLAYGCCKVKQVLEQFIENTVFQVL